MDKRRPILIGHALRRMQATTERPLLTSNVAQRIVETGKLPTVEDQANNLVRWLGDNSSGIGELVPVSLETHSAIIGMTNLAGLHLILNGLKDAGLIKWHPVMGSRQHLHLTFQGMKRYDVLRTEVRRDIHNYLQPRHRHAAIVSTDIVGYTSLMASNEATTLAVRSACMAAIRQVVEANKGRFVKSIGDGTLSEFGSTIDAMQAALDILRSITQQNAARPGNERVELRIGLTVGDVVDEDNDIFGDSVNLAARLQAEAAPGTICTLEHVRGDLANKLEMASEDLGLRELKGIGRRVHVVQITQPM